MITKDILQTLVSDNSMISMIDDNYVQEKQYSGSYLDLVKEEEESLLQDLRSRSWRDVVQSRISMTSPWLYQIIMDPSRAEFLELLRIPEGGVYLDVGSGWGQVAIPLSRRGKSIALDLTQNRLRILEEIARQEKADLGYLQGNFLTFPFQKKIFDLIVFNGSLEWIGSGRADNSSIREEQLKALSKARDILRDDGLIYIGIENSLGAKYLFGAPDDHTHIPHITYFSESSAQQKHTNIKHTSLSAKTWSLAEYLQIFEASGLKVQQCYACFPDYKLIRSMIPLDQVNQALLVHSNRIEEHSGIDGTPLSFNPELQQLYNTLALNGIAHMFCPSYAFILKRGQ